MVEGTTHNGVCTMQEKKKDFNLNRHVARLLLKEPFFAALSRTIDKFPHKGIPTAGVRVNPDTAQFELLYNPDFFEGMEDKLIAGVMKHEFYHLIFEHVTGRLPPGGLSKRWNVATDLAINTHLQSELPENCLMPGQEGTLWEELEHGKPAEWYMANIPWPEEPEGDGNGGGGGGGDGPVQDGQGEDGVGTHDEWKNISENVREIAKERLKSNVKKAAQEAASKGWGTVSGTCRDEIMKRLATHVDWKKVLRYFIKTSQRANKRSSMKSINRRYPYIHPGRKTNRVAQIAISIDQSGSVSNEMLNAFFNELNKLSSLANFTVIPFDTEVAKDKVYVWKKTKSVKVSENVDDHQVLC